MVPEPPVEPEPPVDPAPRLPPPPPSAETGSNSDYDIEVNFTNHIYHVNKIIRDYRAFLSHPDAAEPFASGMVECRVSIFGECQAFEERRNDADFQFLRTAFLNEDGSFVRDPDDGVTDGMHNGVNSTECISDGPCTEEIMWREFVVTDSTSSAPDTVEVHVFTDHGETSADYHYMVGTDAYPMAHHLDYLKLGYWLTPAPNGPGEYGGAFYDASPAYSIAIDSTTRGIRGTAEYEGRTVGVATLSAIGGGRNIWEYTGRVTLVADFGAPHEAGNSFTISGRVEDLDGVSRIPNAYDGSVFSSFDLGPVDGNVAGGTIQTSQGTISTGPDDLTDDYFSSTGELAGSWDISFHGKADRARIPGTSAYFHRAPPVVAGNIRAEGTWQQSPNHDVDSVTYDGVFAAYKTDETHD